ncbi:MAG: hypothetical protein ACI9ND_002298 [Yoonia sp.]|jgi:hypothetical protein
MQVVNGAVLIWVLHATPLRTWAGHWSGALQEALQTVCRTQRISSATHAGLEIGTETAFVEQIG